MKSFLLALGGFLSALVSLTTLGSTSFVGVAILYSVILYLLFYSSKKLSYPFLIGTTVGLELLGDQHFGVASLLAVLIWLLHYVFAERYHFTSLYARYIVALLLMLTAYALLFFALYGFLHRLAILVIVALVVSILGLYRATVEPGPTYELI